MWQEFSRCNIWQQTFLAFQLTSAHKKTYSFRQIIVDLIELLILTSFSILYAIHFRKSFFCAWQTENPVAEWFCLLPQAFFSLFLIPLLSYIFPRPKQNLHRFGGFLISQCLKIRVIQGMQNIWNEAMTSTIKSWKPKPSYTAPALTQFNKLLVFSVFQLFLQMPSYHSFQERA